MILSSCSGRSGVGPACLTFKEIFTFSKGEHFKFKYASLKTCCVNGSGQLNWLNDIWIRTSCGEAAGFGPLEISVYKL